MKKDYLTQIWTAFLSPIVKCLIIMKKFVSPRCTVLLLQEDVLLNVLFVKSLQLQAYILLKSQQFTNTLNLS